MNMLRTVQIFTSPLMFNFQKSDFTLPGSTSAESKDAASPSSQLGSRTDGNPSLHAISLGQTSMHVCCQPAWCNKYLITIFVLFLTADVTFWNNSSYDFFVISVYMYIICLVMHWFFMWILVVGCVVLAQLILADQLSFCIHTHTYIHTYIHVYMHAYIQTYMHTYMQTYIQVYMHAYIHTYFHTYMCTCVHAYLIQHNICLCVCTVILLYILQYDTNCLAYIWDIVAHLKEETNSIFFLLWCRC